jgi:hypothetical protein
MVKYTFRDSLRVSLLLSAVFLIVMSTGRFAQAQLHRTGALVETPPAWMMPSPPIALDREDRESCDNSAHLPPVGDQGMQGSCVAWAAGYNYKTYQEWEEHQWSVTQPDHQFSPAFIYNQINGGSDQGSYGSDAFKVLCDNGCATMADMPYTQFNCTNYPDETDFLHGISYRSQQAYSIYVFNEGLTNVKNMLLNGHCAVLFIYVWSNFDNISSFNNTYCVSQVYGQNRGGHAVTLCGFDDSRPTADGLGAFKVANSWGTGWGAAGYFWMSYEAVLSNVPSQGWVYYSTDRINYTPTLISYFHTTHSDRAAVRYSFGVGNGGSPQWYQDFFDFQMQITTALTYPATNIVVDLTDGSNNLIPSQHNNLFVRCRDARSFNGLTGDLTYFRVENLSWSAGATSIETPQFIPDDGYYVYANVPLAGFPTPQFDITLTPLNPPIVVPAQGGSFSFTAALVDHGPNQNPFTVWGGLRLPNGAFQFTLGPINNLNPPVGVTISRLRDQSIPGSYPSGQYAFVGYTALNFPTVVDSSSFAFTKSATATGDLWLTDAICSGEAFPGEIAPNSKPSTIALNQASPNPFNPTTVISFELPAASLVSMKVYDSAGRVVATLTDGWQEAGSHQITFDGSTLASGLYFVRLQAGDYTAVQKMMLLK